MKKKLTLETPKKKKKTNKTATNSNFSLKVAINQTKHTQMHTHNKKSDGMEGSRTCSNEMKVVFGLKPTLKSIQQMCFKTIYSFKP